MTVERISLPAIRVTYPDGGTRHFVPLFDPSDGSWWALDECGAGVWKSAADVDRFVDEWIAEMGPYGTPATPEESADMDGYRELARLLAELEHQRRADPADEPGVER